MIFETLTIALPATLGRALVLIRKGRCERHRLLCRPCRPDLSSEQTILTKQGKSELAVLSTQIEMVAMVVPPAM